MPNAPCGPRARGYVMKREAAKKSSKASVPCWPDNFTSATKSPPRWPKNLSKAGGRNRFAIEQLSNRELECFNCLASAITRRQIADHLHVGFKTVQAYCARIKEKLNFANATETFARSHPLARKPADKINLIARVGFHPTKSIGRAVQTFCRPATGMAIGLLLYKTLRQLRLQQAISGQNVIIVMPRCWFVHAAIDGEEKYEKTRNPSARQASRWWKS